jgi:hypothetical protein
MDTHEDALHTEQEQTPATTAPHMGLTTRPRKRPSFKTLGVATVVLLCTLVATGFFAVNHIANDSLPGDPLYPFKTQVAEKAFLYTKLSTESKLSYTQNLFEKRLSELIILRDDTSSSSADTLSTLANLVNANTDSVLSGIADDTSIPAEKKVALLATLSTHARAMEILVTDAAEFSSISEQISTLESTVNESLDLEVTKFITANDTVAIERFLSEQIRYVSEHAPELAFGSTAQNLVLKRVADTQDAIASKNMTEALGYILRAKQAFIIDSLLQDGERVPEDGVLPEPLPMPEGS